MIFQFFSSSFFLSPDSAEVDFFAPLPSLPSPPALCVSLYSSWASAFSSRTRQVRVHDECNGSDVFGSDICTCRPYLTHAIEECIRTAQNGGTGVCIYYRKEGRALGEGEPTSRRAKRHLIPSLL